MPSSSDSLYDLLASLPPRQLRRELQRLTPEQLIALLYSWQAQSRPNQRIPLGDWVTWLILAGRGWGKTRTGAETLKQWEAEGIRRMALVAATPADARDVMIQGESGLLHIYPESQVPSYQASLRRVIWPSGATATIYSAHKHEDKSGLRGPQHEKAWGDEPAKWQYPGNLEQLMLGLRLGDAPQAVLTGTPRPIPLIRDLVKDSRKPNSTTVVTFGSTYENQGNLAASWFSRIISRYVGTRLGEQELMAKVLDDIEGALWTFQMLRDCYDEVSSYDDEGGVNPELRDSMERTCIAVDPSVGDGEIPDPTQEITAETGIMAIGRRNRQGHLLEDASLYAHPSIWAEKVVETYERWNANYVVAEKNNGGELVRLTIQSAKGGKHIPVKLVTASRGKYTRAEPVAALHARGFIRHHLVSAPLEDQLTTWIPGAKSPDRLDAYVWGMTELLCDLLEVGAYVVGEDEKHVEKHGNLVALPNAQQVDPGILAALKSEGFYAP